MDDFKRAQLLTDRNDDILLYFHRTFSQFIAKLLTKNLEYVYQGPPYDPDYRAFLHLAEELVKTHRVRIHTLNHDLYVEHLANSDSIGEIDNGFEELGSLFYGRVSNENGEDVIRLSRFVDKFEKPFCLYKLHGSIDQFYVGHRRVDWIKLKKGMSNWRISKEVKKNGVLQYVRHSADVVPDFLTGTKKRS